MRNVGGGLLMVSIMALVPYLDANIPDSSNWPLKSQQRTAFRKLQYLSEELLWVFQYFLLSAFEIECTLHVRLNQSF